MTKNIVRRAIGWLAPALPAVAACHRGSVPACAVAPPASIVVPSVHADAGHNGLGQSRGDGGSAESFESYAEQVYSSIADERWADADALLASRDGSIHGDCIGPGEERATHGDRLVYGGRAIVALTAEGKVEWHRLVDGCLAYADAELVAYVGRDVVIEGPGRWVLEKDVLVDGPLHVSKYWALVLGGNEQFLAVRRQTGEVLGGKHMGGRVILRAREHPPIAATVVGKFMIIVSELASPKRFLYRADRTTPARIVGCGGRNLLAAVARGDDGVVLHVDTDEPDRTRLCFVDANGTTTRVTDLGTATCGLARPVACAWTFAASASTMLAFGTYRGHLKIVDARTGHDLRIVLPGGTHSEGGSPSHFFACETGICATLERDGPEPVQLETTVTRSANEAIFSPRTPSARSAWCIRNALPVPPPLCHDRN